MLSPMHGQRGWGTVLYSDSIEQSAAQSALTDLNHIGNNCFVTI